jgi:hypothetical protein
MEHASRTPERPRPGPIAAERATQRPAAAQAPGRNRPRARTLQALGEAINRSPRVEALRTLSSGIHASARLVAQRQQLQRRAPAPAFNQPVAAALIPFDQNPMASIGERIIFNSTYADAAPIPGATYDLRYTAVGGTFGTRSGATVKNVAGFVSGNVNFFVSSSWHGQHPVTVTLDLIETLPAPVAVGLAPPPPAPPPAIIDTNVWTFGYRGSSPTKMTQTNTEGERPLGSVYTYLMSGPRAGVNYQGHTVLERFLPNTSNINYTDLKQSFKNANPYVRTKDEITAYFFGGPGDNGTFTIDALNQIYDAHGGGVPSLATFNAAHKFSKEATSDLPQIYETSAGNIIGRYAIRRILKTNGVQKVKKFRT